MSESGDDASFHVVDLSAVEPDAARRRNLIAWGAEYLSSTDEDSSIRAASLALEFRDYAFRAARQRGQKMTFWQSKLVAIGLLTACIRFKAEAQGSGHVRH
jgi:hypothetical protein